MTTDPAITRARALRRDATPPERLLWGFLRTLRQEGYHCRRQAPFRGYVLDFVCYRRRLVVEVDGDQHGRAAQANHDAVRDKVLAREGFRTLRFSAPDVSRNLEGVSIAIWSNLTAPTPTLPTRGRGRYVSLPRVGRVGVRAHRGRIGLPMPLTTPPASPR